MTINSQPSTTESKKKKNKKKLSKQLEQEQNHRNGDHMDSYQQGGGEGGGGERGGKGTENKKHQSYVENRQGESKNSIGNGEAKELICITHGHKVREGLLEGGGTPGREGQRRKN